MNILFICSANKDRSLTAEEYAREYYPQHSYESAGSNQKICFKLGTQYMSRELLDWADQVLVMEKKHQGEIQHVFGHLYGKKISVLSIRDHYPYNSAELKELLKDKLKEYL